MNYIKKISTSTAVTFACPKTQASFSQEKELEFCQRPKTAEPKMNEV